VRVRTGVVALVALVGVGQGALLVLGGNDDADSEACPTLSAEEMAELSDDGPVVVTGACKGDSEDCPHLSEDYLESEEGQRYLRDLEKLTGPTDSSGWSGDSYATYFAVSCDD